VPLFRGSFYCLGL
ncbi:putative transmembrane protein, partial [Chlamydia psittaci 02DC24]